MSFIQSNPQTHPHLSWTDHDPFLTEPLPVPVDSDFLDRLHLRAEADTDPNRCCFLYDHSTEQYLFVDSRLAAVTGIDSQQLLSEEDASISRQILHDDDYQLLGQHIKPSYHKILESLAPEACLRLRTTYVGRLRNATQESHPTVRVFAKVLGMSRWGKPRYDLIVVTRLPVRIERCQFAYTTSPSIQPPSCQSYKFSAMLVLNDLSRWHALSRRELQILEILAEGKTSREIGDQLFISSHTVDTHRRNIIRKTGVRNTAELIRLFRNKRK